MALTPYQRRVEAPLTAQPQPLVDTRIPDVGGKIANMGNILLDVAEPILAQRAKTQALADFAADGIAIDEEGKLHAPETPDGGRVYQAVYNEAKETQYLLEAGNAGEERYNEVYFGKDSIGKTPQEMHDEALAITQGMLDGADPTLRPRLFERLMREVRQRDLRAMGEYQRQDRKNLAASLKNSVDRERQKIIDAFLIGTPEGDDQASASMLIATEAMVRMEALGMVPEGSTEEFQRQFGSYQGYGTVLRLIRENPDASGDDISMLRDMLKGTGYGSVFGLTFNAETDDIRALIPVRQIAHALSSHLAELEADAFKASREEITKNAADNLLASVGMGEGQGSRTDKQWERLIDIAAAKLNVNPLTPDGAAQLYTRLGGLSESYYKKVFRNLGEKTPEELERLIPLYQGLRNMIGRDGTEVNLIEGRMETADRAFMYHYINAREAGGSDPQGALARAKAAVEARLGITQNAMAKTLRDEMGAATYAEVYDKIDDNLPVTWDKLGLEAQRYIVTDAAQLVAMGVPTDKAFQSSARTFEANFVAAPFNIGSGTAGDPVWVLRPNSVPGIFDINSPLEKRFDWAIPVVEDALNNLAGEQFPGVPDVSNLVLGKNVFVQPVGPEISKGRRVFGLIYYDRELTNVPAGLRDKNGSPLLIDLGRAQKVQNKWAEDYHTAKQASIDEGIELRVAAYPTPDILQALVAGINAGAWPIVDNLQEKGNPQSIAAYNAWEKGHNETYGEESGEQPNHVRPPIGGWGLSSPFDPYGVPLRPIKTGDGQPPMAPINEEDYTVPGIISKRTDITRDAVSGTGLSSLFRSTARDLGISAVELIAIGLAGPSSEPSQERYKVGETNSAVERLAALVAHAKGAGYRPGMGWRKLYAALSAGDVNASVAASVISKEQFAQARAWLGSN